MFLKLQGQVIRSHPGGMPRAKTTQGVLISLWETRVQPSPALSLGYIVGTRRKTLLLLKRSLTDPQAEAELPCWDILWEMLGAGSCLLELS